MAWRHTGEVLRRGGIWDRLCIQLAGQGQGPVQPFHSLPLRPGSKCPSPESGLSGEEAPSLPGSSCSKDPRMAEGMGGKAWPAQSLGLSRGLGPVCFGNCLQKHLHLHPCHQAYEQGRPETVTPVL